MAPKDHGQQTAEQRERWTNLLQAGEQAARSPSEEGPKESKNEGHRQGYHDSPFPVS
jgi:hypothetical protein